MKVLENLGILFLALWMIITSALNLFPIDLPNIRMWVNVLAILAGAFLILFRLKDKKAYINVAMLLLSVQLILSGLFFLLNVQFTGSMVLFDMLKIGAGLFFLPAIVDLRSFYSLGVFFLGLLLLAGVLVPMLGIAIPSFQVVLGIIAVTSSLFLLLGM